MKPKLDWHDIKSELHRRSMTLTKLAELNGLDPTACRKVKSHTNRKAEAVIAAFIGRKPEELWPDRYPIQTSRIFDSKKWAALESQKATTSADTRKAA
ncbi:helix-turn-helix domain-containing protein [Rhizobium herbae]|uniref:Ner family transcriptional regulator n=1 Tax=Rhizobium herbae TaxID=508661 RepID=A0ABS4EWJ8_9HYPH|nr:helix-turn-helix domain-containing protein [Rhizobium herbae]MBP1862176.1 Ner family transcriptional regulator [Rhizobium herbae]